jgi:hypothetical protein
VKFAPIRAPQSPPNFRRNSLFSRASLVFAMRCGYKPFGCQSRVCRVEPNVSLKTPGDRSRDAPVPELTAKIARRLGRPTARLSTGP